MGAMLVANTTIAATADSKNRSVAPDCRFPDIAFG